MSDNTATGTTRSQGAVRTRVTGAEGIELAVADTGPPPDHPEAATLVLVHGYPDNSEMWLPVVDGLCDRFRVVTYDVRGAGASDVPPSTRGYRLELLVEDLAAVLDATSPDRPVHLVGHDWGSVQLWEAVTTDRLAGRILSYTSITGPGLDHIGHWIRARLRPNLRALRELFRQGRSSWYVAAFHLPGARLYWRFGGARAVVRSLVALRELPAGTEPWPSLAADGANGIGLYRANILGRIRRPQRRSTELPVQVVVPVNDRFVRPALSDDVGRWAANLWRRDVAGHHWITRSHPDRVARWVGELVDFVEDGRATPSLRRARADHLKATRPDEGKVAVVTGAGSGIGRQAALALAERGADVVAVDIDPVSAERTATLCRDLGTEATHHQVDVGDVEAMEALAKAVERDHGGADIVVNNAGVGLAGAFLDTSVEDWERLLRVNLWGVIHGSRLFGRQMAARGEGGHIVNVASAAAFMPSRAFPAYATSKAAVLMLSECLRAELTDKNIGVTAICPGVVNTGIVDATRFVGVSDSEQDRLRTVTQRLYARRGAGPDRVADAIVQALDTNRPVVPVTAEAKVARALSRFAPRVARWIARLDPVSRL